MKVLVACDSFKDALSAQEVCAAIVEGLQVSLPEARIVSLPLSDGGEGAANIWQYHTQGTWRTCLVTDPLFRKVDARYVIASDTAFIELATASGLQLLKPQERNPLYTTTLGTGELIKDAIKQGCKQIRLSIGGSATNDAGMGIAAALGYQFLDEQNVELSPIGSNLEKVRTIRFNKSNPFIAAVQSKKVKIEVWCDVQNPLHGMHGAAQVFAAQKGADAAVIKQLDNGLSHFANCLRAEFGKDYANLAGAGAAGGVGAGAVAFLQARLRSGIEAILELVQFDQQLETVDWIITGEGKIDQQTQGGKLISGITQHAQRQAIPVVALCGTLLASHQELQQLGLRAAFSILNRPLSLAEALTATADLLKATSTQVGMLLRE